MAEGFLPVNRREMQEKGWTRPDFVYITGDAYVDHPSFGTAIISRVLEAEGFKVAILPQPDWRDENSVREFGCPRLGFLISSGNMDSMVNHYTVNKRRRHQDAYTPGGAFGRRPDYAVTVYANMVRRAFPDSPVIAGGIEASLRRLGHYDYWSDSVKRSVLIQAPVDIVSYGMGERSIVEIAQALDSGLDVKDITFIRGTAFKVRDISTWRQDSLLLPSFQEISSDKKSYARSFAIQYRNTDPFSGRRLIEQYGAHMFVIQNPPAMPLSRQEMDDVYDLPYMRTWHPSCDAAGGVPAMAEIRFSLTSSRGCFGGCSFCALTFHQGRIIQARSHESIIKEARLLTKQPDFHGYIHDVGGPTANFRHPACKKQLKAGACPDKQCLFPQPCSQLIADHSDYISLLRSLRAIPGVKKVFIRSGIRFDYVLADKKNDFLRELCKYHVSGQLKVAPEHVSDQVLALLGKPRNEVYERFKRAYADMNRRLGLKQYLVPYLMSSHPGSTMKDAIMLAEHVRDIGYMPQQVQDFYPTPSTLSTCMYYTGLDPRTMEEVYIPSDPHEKAMQRALIQYRDPKNYDLVKEALLREGRQDLIGYGKNALIRPRKPGSKQKNYQNNRQDRRKHETYHSGTGRKRSKTR